METSCSKKLSCVPLLCQFGPMEIGFMVSNQRYCVWIFQIWVYILDLWASLWIYGFSFNNQFFIVELVCDFLSFTWLGVSSYAYIYGSFNPRPSKKYIHLSSFIILNYFKLQKWRYFFHSSRHLSKIWNIYVILMMTQKTFMDLVEA